MKTLINSLLITGIALTLASGCKKKPEASHVEVSAPTEPAAYPEAAFESAQKQGKQSAAAAPGTLPYLDAKNGFRDVVFGQSEQDIPNLVLKNFDEAHGLKTYTRSGENLFLNGVPLQSIEYTFLKGELFSVVAKWSAEDKRAVLKNASITSLAPFCSSLYGPAKRRSITKDSAEYVWRGKHVELILNETHLPGVPDKIHGGWAMAPSTRGAMLIQSIDRRKTLGAEMASSNSEKKDGL
jgi:hypothetical protein